MTNQQIGPLQDRAQNWEQEGKYKWLLKNNPRIVDHFDIDHYAKVREARAVKELMEKK